MGEQFLMYCLLFPSLDKRNPGCEQPGYNDVVRLKNTVAWVLAPGLQFMGLLFGMWEVVDSVH